MESKKRIYGKAPELILKRSIFENIRSRSADVIKGAGVGTDSALIRASSGYFSVATSGTVDYTNEDREYYTFYRAFNNLAAGGSRPEAAVLNLILPPDTDEKRVKEIIKRYDVLCDRHGMEICGGHTQYTSGAAEIFTVVTMVGEMYKTDRIVGKNAALLSGDKNPATLTGDKNAAALSGGKKASAGMEIVMTGYAGIEGTAVLANDYAPVLKTRFSDSFLSDCRALKEQIPVEEEAKTAFQNGAIRIHDVSGSGIFGAVWELSCACDSGVEIDLRKIPVLQETVEITEFFDVNPYQMASSGSLLIVTDRGRMLTAALSERGIPSAVIGRLTPGRDRTVFNGDDIRYLEPPRGDEIYRARSRGEAMTLRA